MKSIKEKSKEHLNSVYAGYDDVRKDAFIEKARKWFEKQPEQYDANGVRVYGEEDFEDFKKYIGE